MFNSRNDAGRAAMVAACVGLAFVGTFTGSPRATAAGGVYGDPQAAAKYWQEQSLNDPGVEYPDEQVSIATFTSAWHTGEDSIIVTAATG
jgi:hypothetical protein